MDQSEARLSWSSDQVDGLVTVLDLIRSRGVATRPDLVRGSGLGRSVVSQRVAQLIDCGLLLEGGLAGSTGGRSARELRIRADAGSVLVASLGATSIDVALADLSGQLVAQYVEAANVAHGPEEVLGRVERLFDDLLAGHPSEASRLWGIGIGLPGPVEFATGRPVAPPIMPGWDDYPVRERFAHRHAVPTWVENDVNVMALGELRAGVAMDAKDVLFVKIGSGIGAGLITSGRLHRGAQGAAGDIGHVAVMEASDVACRCGNINCLEALAGGYALGRQADIAAAEGRSPFLAGIAHSGHALEASDVAEGANHGDPFCVELLVRAGHFVGGVLATLVNFYNPSLIVLGGGVTGAGDLLLASIRQSVYRRSLPLATRHLRIVCSTLGQDAGAIGAASLVIDELFSRLRLGLWLGDGSPRGRIDLSDASAA